MNFRHLQKLSVFCKYNTLYRTVKTPGPGLIHHAVTPDATESEICVPKSFRHSSPVERPSSVQCSCTSNACYSSLALHPPHPVIKKRSSGTRSALKATRSFRGSMKNARGFKTKSEKLFGNGESKKSDKLMCSSPKTPSKTRNAKHTEEVKLKKILSSILRNHDKRYDTFTERSERLQILNHHRSEVEAVIQRDNLLRKKSKENIRVKEEHTTSCPASKKIVKIQDPFNPSRRYYSTKRTFTPDFPSDQTSSSPEKSRSKPRVWPPAKKRKGSPPPAKDPEEPLVASSNCPEPPDSAGLPYFYRRVLVQDEDGESEREQMQRVYFNYPDKIVSVENISQDYEKFLKAEQNLTSNIPVEVEYVKEVINKSVERISEAEYLNSLNKTSRKLLEEEYFQKITNDSRKRPTTARTPKRDSIRNISVEYVRRISTKSTNNIFKEETKIPKISLSKSQHQQLENDTKYELLSNIEIMELANSNNEDQTELDEPVTNSRERKHRNFLNAIHCDLSQNKIVEFANLKQLEKDTKYELLSKNEIVELANPNNELTVPIMSSKEEKYRNFLNTINCDLEYCENISKQLEEKFNMELTSYNAEVEPKNIEAKNLVQNFIKNANDKLKVTLSSNNLEIMEKKQKISKQPWEMTVREFDNKIAENRNAQKINNKKTINFEFTEPSNIKENVTHKTEFFDSMPEVKKTDSVEDFIKYDNKYKVLDEILKQFEGSSSQKQFEDAFDKAFLEAKSITTNLQNSHTNLSDRKLFTKDSTKGMTQTYIEPEKFATIVQKNNNVQEIKDSIITEDLARASTSSIFLSASNSMESIPCENKASNQFPTRFSPMQYKEGSEKKKVIKFPQIKSGGSNTNNTEGNVVGVVQLLYKNPILAEQAPEEKQAFLKQMQDVCNAEKYESEISPGEKQAFLKLMQDVCNAEKYESELPPGEKQAFLKLMQDVCNAEKYESEIPPGEKQAFLKLMQDVCNAEKYESEIPPKSVESTTVSLNPIKKYLKDAVVDAKASRGTLTLYLDSSKIHTEFNDLGGLYKEPEQPQKQTKQDEVPEVRFDENVTASRNQPLKEPEVKEYLGIISVSMNPFSKLKNDMPDELSEFSKLEKVSPVGLMDVIQKRGTLTIVLKPFNEQAEKKSNDLSIIEKICKEELKTLQTRQILEVEEMKNISEDREKANFSKYVEKTAIKPNINKTLLENPIKRSFESPKQENDTSKEPQKILSVIDKIWSQVEEEAKIAIKQMEKSSQSSTFKANKPVSTDSKTEQLNTIQNLKSKAAKQLEDNYQKDKKDALPIKKNDLKSKYIQIKNPDPVATNVTKHPKDISKQPKKYAFPVKANSKSFSTNSKLQVTKQSVDIFQQAEKDASPIKKSNSNQIKDTGLASANLKSKVAKQPENISQQAKKDATPRKKNYIQVIYTNPAIASLNKKVTKQPEDISQEDEKDMLPIKSNIIKVNTIQLKDADPMSAETFKSNAAKLLEDTCKYSKKDALPLKNADITSSSIQGKDADFIPTKLSSEAINLIENIYQHALPIKKNKIQVKDEDVIMTNVINQPSHKQLPVLTLSVQRSCDPVSNTRKVQSTPKIQALQKTTSYSAGGCRGKDRVKHSDDPFQRFKPDPYKKKQKKVCPRAVPNDLRINMKADDSKQKDKDACMKKKTSKCIQDICDEINQEPKPLPLRCPSPGSPVRDDCKKRKRSPCAGSDPCKTQSCTSNDDPFHRKPKKKKKEATCKPPCSPCPDEKKSPCSVSKKKSSCSPCKMPSTCDSSCKKPACPAPKKTPPCSPCDKKPSPCMKKSASSVPKKESPCNPCKKQPSKKPSSCDSSDNKPPCPKPKKDPCCICKIQLSVCKKESSCDPCKPKEDPCMKKSPCPKPKKDPCKKKSPCPKPKKKEPCKPVCPKPKKCPPTKKSDPCKKKSPCPKPKKKPCSPCKKKKPAFNPCKKKDKKKDPCKKKSTCGPSKTQSAPCCKKPDTVKTPKKTKSDPCSAIMNMFNFLCGKKKKPAKEPSKKKSSCDQRKTKSTTTLKKSDPCDPCKKKSAVKKSKSCDLCKNDGKLDKKDAFNYMCRKSKVTSKAEFNKLCQKKAEACKPTKTPVVSCPAPKKKKVDVCVCEPEKKQKKFCQGPPKAKRKVTSVKKPKKKFCQGPRVTSVKKGVKHCKGNKLGPKKSRTPGKRNPCQITEPKKTSKCPPKKKKKSPCPSPCGPSKSKPKPKSPCSPCKPKQKPSPCPPCKPKPKPKSPCSPCKPKPKPKPPCSPCKPKPKPKSPCSPCKPKPSSCDPCKPKPKPKPPCSPCKPKPKPESPCSPCKPKPSSCDPCKPKPKPESPCSPCKPKPKPSSGGPCKPTPKPESPCAPRKAKYPITYKAPPSKYCFDTKKSDTSACSPCKKSASKSSCTSKTKPVKKKSGTSPCSPCKKSASKSSCTSGTKPAKKKSGKKLAPPTCKKSTSSSGSKPATKTSCPPPCSPCKKSASKSSCTSGTKPTKKKIGKTLAPPTCKKSASSSGIKPATKTSCPPPCSPCKKSASKSSCTSGTKPTKKKIGKTLAPPTCKKSASSSGSKPTTKISCSPCKKSASCTSGTKPAKKKSGRTLAPPTCKKSTSSSDPTCKKAASKISCCSRSKPVKKECCTDVSPPKFKKFPSKSCSSSQIKPAKKRSGMALCPPTCKTSASRSSCCSSSKPVKKKSRTDVSPPKYKKSTSKTSCCSEIKPDKKKCGKTIAPPTSKKSTSCSSLSSGKKCVKKGSDLKLAPPTSKKCTSMLSCCSGSKPTKKKSGVKICPPTSKKTVSGSNLCNKATAVKMNNKWLSQCSRGPTESSENEWEINKIPCTNVLKESVGKPAKKQSHSKLPCPTCSSQSTKCGSERKKRKQASVLPGSPPVCSKIVISRPTSSKKKTTPCTPCKCEEPKKKKSGGGKICGKSSSGSIPPPKSKPQKPCVSECKPQKPCVSECKPQKPCVSDCKPQQINEMKCHPCKKFTEKPVKKPTPMFRKCKSNPNLYTRKDVCRSTTPYEPPRIYKVQSYRFTVLGPKTKDSFDKICRKKADPCKPPTLPKQNVTKCNALAKCLKHRKQEVTEDYLDQIEEEIKKKQCIAETSMKEMQKVAKKVPDQTPPKYIQILRRLQCHSTTSTGNYQSYRPPRCTQNTDCCIPKSKGLGR